MTVLHTRTFKAVAAIVLVALISTVTASRARILRAIGWVLVVDEPIRNADIIVVAIDADGAGTLEAADLVKQGVAGRVAVFADPPDNVDLEFIRRGLPYEDVAARSLRELRSLGVSEVELIPPSVAGTEDEGLVLPAWCDRFDFKSVSIVSTTDHSRRLKRVLDRAMKSHRTTVWVRAARFSAFDPDAWWKTRRDLRTAIVEFEKLALDFARHPFT